MRSESSDFLSADFLGANGYSVFLTVLFSPSQRNFEFGKIDETGKVTQDYPVLLTLSSLLRQCLFPVRRDQVMNALGIQCLSTLAGNVQVSGEPAGLILARFGQS